MNTLEAIKSRRSIRKYKPDVAVPGEIVTQLLEAAMMAPSACNTRPWEFVVVESRDVKEQIMTAMPFTQMLRTAPLAIVVCGRPWVQENICPGFWPQDCGAAVENTCWRQGSWDTAAAGAGVIRWSTGWRPCKSSWMWKVFRLRWWLWARPMSRRRRKDFWTRPG